MGRIYRLMLTEAVLKLDGKVQIVNVRVRVEWRVFDRRSKWRGLDGNWENVDGTQRSHGVRGSPDSHVTCNTSENVRA